MTKCSVIIPCRDGEEFLRATLASLTSQTSDVHVTVVDDHSQDGTLAILEDFPWVNHIRYPKREKKSHARIGMLCNLALGVLPESEFYMVSGDDMIFPNDYVELVTHYMAQEGVSIASGHSRGAVPVGAPDGSGRIFTAEAWRKFTPFHESPAWESLPMALSLLWDDIKLGKYPVKKIHLRPDQGSLRRWGHACYTLGRPFAWLVIRATLDVLRGHKPPGQAFSMLVGYGEYWIKRKPKVDESDQIRKYNRDRMKNKLKEVLRWPRNQLKKRFSKE